jgi:hypothetical protein
MKIITSQRSVHSTPQIKSQSKVGYKPSHKIKGDAFEDYIITLFENKSGRFKLIEWRSDNKASNGMYALSNMLPDLEFQCKIKNGYQRFAIECKWRTEFADGIDWANQYQRDNYLKYQRHNNIQVFIAIGVGGDSDLPEKLFVTPLNNISSQLRVLEHHLMPYKRNPRRRFFYDAKQLKLL